VISDSSRFGHQTTTTGLGLGCHIGCTKPKFEKQNHTENPATQMFK